MPTEAGEAVPRPLGGIRKQTCNETFTVETPMGITYVSGSCIQKGKEKPHWFSDVHSRYESEKTQRKGRVGLHPKGDVSMAAPQLEDGHPPQGLDNFRGEGFVKTLLAHDC